MSAADICARKPDSSRIESNPLQSRAKTENKERRFEIADLMIRRVTNRRGLKRQFVNRRSLGFYHAVITRFLALAFVLCFIPLAPAREPQTSPPPTQSIRARALGIPFEGTPGQLNAITDVAGVEVGYTTLIEGEGKLDVGKGPVRTGVTAILPRGKNDDPVYAGVFSLNGNGEMTGTAWIEEGGFLEEPIAITNTHSVGVVRDAIIDWRVKKGGADPGGFYWSLPAVAETWDGWLNDVNGFPLGLSHPRRYREFIASAVGVTMIMDRLERFVPPANPKMVLWPGADDRLFFPRARDPQLLEQLGIAPGTVVLCYTGNAHLANARE